MSRAGTKTNFTDEQLQQIKIFMDKIFIELEREYSEKKDELRNKSLEKLTTEIEQKILNDVNHQGISNTVKKFIVYEKNYVSIMALKLYNSQFSNHQIALDIAQYEQFYGSRTEIDPKKMTGSLEYLSRIQRHLLGIENKLRALQIRLSKINYEEIANIHSLTEAFISVDEMNTTLKSKISAIKPIVEALETLSLNHSGLSPDLAQLGKIKQLQHQCLVNINKAIAQQHGIIKRSSPITNDSFSVVVPDENNNLTASSAQLVKRNFISANDNVKNSEKLTTAPAPFSTLRDNYIINFSNGDADERYAILNSAELTPQEVSALTQTSATTVTTYPQQGTSPLTTVWISDRTAEGTKPYLPEDKRFEGIVLFLKYCDKKPGRNSTIVIAGKWDIETLDQTIECCLATGRPFKFGENFKIILGRNHENEEIGFKKEGVNWVSVVRRDNNWIKATDNKYDPAMLTLMKTAVDAKIHFQTSNKPYIANAEKLSTFKKHHEKINSISPYSEQLKELHDEIFIHSFDHKALPVPRTEPRIPHKPNPHTFYQGGTSPSITDNKPVTPESKYPPPRT